MSCPDPYRPDNPYDDASTPDAGPKVHSQLPSDAEIRGLTSALAAHGGGAASEDLALDLILNQIVEQACLATGATGAAIALTRGGEMVCRATTGRNAPDLGIRLDNAGFSAECLRVGTLQRCDDTEIDPRVDAAACRLLGVRSILVVPLWYWGEFMGIFEIFSPRPNAFGERDEQTLQALAYRIVRHTKETSGRIAGFVDKGEDLPEFPAPEPELLPEPTPDSPLPRSRTKVVELKTQPKESSELRDRWTPFLVACSAFIACVIVGLMLWRAGNPRSTAEKPVRSIPAEPQAEELDLGPVSTASASTPPAQEEPNPEVLRQESTKPKTSKATRQSESAAGVVVSAASRKDLQPTPATGGGLAIYDKGKLIYGTPLPDPNRPEVASPKSEAVNPTSAAPKAAKPPVLAKSLPADAPPDLMDGNFVRLKPELADTLLADRVEPDYPDAARRSHIQGSVTLETLIGANGKVQEVTPVSGNPQLADAAVNAIRQWRYKPFTVDGKKVPIRTQVTVQFMLPQ